MSSKRRSSNAKPILITLNPVEIDGDFVNSAPPYLSIGGGLKLIPSA